MINKYSVSNAASIMKKTREEMGREYTQEKMAELLGLKNRQSYGNFENGHTLPNWEQVLILCNVFECDIGYLTGEHSTKKHVNANTQELTGLSEKAVEKLKAMNESNKWKWGINTLSKIIECDEFETLVGTITDFALEDENAKVPDFDTADIQEISELKITDVRALHTQNTFQKIIKQVRTQLYKYSPYNEKGMGDENYERVSFQLSQYQFANNCYKNNYLTEDEFNEIIRLIDIEDYDGCGEIW